jgi:predicted double-glycine peptidase
LDLKNLVKELGYSISIVKINSSTIFDLKGPVLVPIKIDDWEHFVVLKGVKNGYVFLADPFRGNVRTSVYTFFSQWNGIMVVLGKSGFGLPHKYPLALLESFYDKWPEKHSIRIIRPNFHPQL